MYIYLSNENETTVEVFFDDFTVSHTKSPVVQADDYYPFGLTFNSYQRENATPNRWKFQGQEHIDDLDLGWDSFKWRNHQPEIGRFFNVDPLAEDYYYNSPYAFSENHVVAHIELEGLEKVSIQKGLDKNESYNIVYSTQRETSGGKRFSSKLQNQKEVNVLYFLSNDYSSGSNTPKPLSSMEEYGELKKANKSRYSELDDKEVETAMEGKSLMLIGIDKDALGKKIDESTYTLNHEEFHAESTLDGNSGPEKNKEDHDKYYGEKRSDSPNDSDVKTNPKYSNTIANKQYKEIDKILETKKKN